MKPFFLFSVAAVAAAPLSPCAARADIAAFQFEVGAGAQVAHLVVDFAQTGSQPGEAYGFSYRFDAGDGQTVEDALDALAEEPDFDYFFEDFSFGRAVNGFAIREDLLDTGGFSGGTNTFWQVFNGPGVGEAFSLADAANAGVSDLTLESGVVTGFAIAAFDPATFVTVSSVIPRTFVVPEPTSLLATAAGGLILLGRRRRSVA